MKKHFTAAVVIVLALSLALPARATGGTAPWTAAEANRVANEAETAVTAETAEALAPETSQEEQRQQADTAGVYLDGKLIEMSAPAVMIDSATYVPVRSFCTAMGASSVSWDADTLTVCADAGSFTIEAALDAEYITANGRCLYVPSGNRIIGGVFMAPVRVLAAAYDAAVSWDSETGSVYITSGSGMILSGDEYYDSENLKWLAHIINAEARGECLEGKIAVGNVVMNRVVSDYYPDTVYDVIFDGVQFTPALTGSIYNDPSAESWAAAKLVLEGADVAGDSMFFAQASLSCWASRNRTLSTTIGGHAFYL